MEVSSKQVDIFEKMKNDPIYTTDENESGNRFKVSMSDEEDEQLQFHKNKKPKLQKNKRKQADKNLNLNNNINNWYKVTTKNKFLKNINFLKSDNLDDINWFNTNPDIKNKEIEMNFVKKEYNLQSFLDEHNKEKERLEKLEKEDVSWDDLDNNSSSNSIIFELDEKNTKEDDIIRNTLKLKNNKYFELLKKKYENNKNKYNFDIKKCTNREDLKNYAMNVFYEKREKQKNNNIDTINKQFEENTIYDMCNKRKKSESDKSVNSNDFKDKEDEFYIDEDENIKEVKNDFSENSEEIENNSQMNEENSEKNKDNDNISKNSNNIEQSIKSHSNNNTINMVENEENFLDNKFYNDLTDDNNNFIGYNESEDDNKLIQGKYRRKIDFKRERKQKLENRRKLIAERNKEEFKNLNDDNIFEKEAELDQDEINNLETKNIIERMLLKENLKDENDNFDELNRNDNSLINDSFNSQDMIEEDEKNARIKIMEDIQNDDNKIKENILKGNYINKYNNTVNDNSEEKDKIDRLKDHLFEEYDENNEDKNDEDYYDDTKLLENHIDEDDEKDEEFQKIQNDLKEKTQNPFKNISDILKHSKEKIDNLNKNKVINIDPHFNSMLRYINSKDKIDTNKEILNEYGVQDIKNMKGFINIDN